MGLLENKDLHWCNLFIKYLLFLINTVIWLLGVGLLAIGIYVQVESTFDMLRLSSVLTSPAIVMIILGALLFILGFCGCLGALLEIFFLLVAYCILLSIILLVEISLVVYVFLQQDEAFNTLETLFFEAISNYFDDVNLRNLIDFIQADLFRCCGVTSPRDWERNVYFDCNSMAFQRCSVPFSCCNIEEGDVINFQCGYRALESDTTAMIYPTGCFTTARSFVQGNVYVFAGVGIGLLVFQIVNIILAAGLAVDIHKEKKIIKAQKKHDKEMSKLS